MASIEIKHELRPCKVTVKTKTPHGTQTDVINGLFHMWSVEAWMYSPVMTCQVGGQMQKTYGIVEREDGSVDLYEPQQIKFLDGKTGEYCWN